MNTNLNLPAGYTVLSEEEMTYTEGGSAILTGLVAVTSTIGFGDIGLSFGATGVVAILCGIGFLKVNKRLKG